MPQLHVLICSRASDIKAESFSADTKVLNHVDMENKRVKDVTDAILYDLLPAAIASVTQEVDEVPQDLTWDLCQVCSAHPLWRLYLFL